MKNLLLCVAVFAFGCDASIHSTTSLARPAIAASRVNCFESMPPHAEIVGQIHVQNISGFSHYLLHPEKRQMINQAAAMGANGLVLYPPTIQMIVGYQQDGTAIYVPEK